MADTTDTTAATAATRPEAIGLALDVLREMLSDPDQRLDQCPARMARANQAARALAGVQAPPAAQEAEPDEGPAGSGGWKSHAEAMERERDYYLQRVRTLEEHQEGQVWYWQDDGGDHLESMVNSLPVVIRADQLRALLAVAPRPQADAGAVPAGGLRRIGRIQHDSLGHPQAVLETAYDLFGNGWRPGTPIYSDEAAAPQAPAAAADHVAAFWASVEDGTVFDDISPETWHLVDKLVEQLKAAGDTAFIDEAPTPAAALAPAIDIKRAAEAIAVKVAKNCGGVPQLTFPHIYLGLKDLLAAAPTQEADGWMPIETAPDGERVLLGPRHAPVVGTVSHPMPWDERQEPAVSVVHYNGNRLVAGYRCSEWHRLPGAARAQEAVPLTQAARDVLAERRRQVEAEGWTPEHDDQYPPGTMARAGGCYATINTYPTPTMWPWAPEWWKPRDDRSNYVRAAALLLAELESLDRAAAARARQEGGGA